MMPLAGVAFVAPAFGAGRAQPADVVAGDGVAVGARLDLDAVAAEVANDQTADRASVGGARQHQTIAGETVVAVQDDGWPVAVDRKAVVGAGVQNDRVGDRRQG